MSGNFRPKSKSETEPTEKDRWGTQWPCFADAVELYGKRFLWDVCAEAVTSKCAEYYYGPDNSFDGHPQDALSVELWVEDWWCNPPFSMKREFIQHARQQQRAGRSGMMLLPYEPAALWWHTLLDEDVIIYEPAGRYNFLEVDGVTEKNNVNFPIALVCFPAHHLGGQVIRVRYRKGIGKHHLIDGVVP